MSCSVSWFFAKIYSVEAQDNTFIGLINTEHEQSVYSGNSGNWWRGRKDSGRSIMSDSRG